MEPKPWLKEIKPYPPGKTLEEIKRELSLEGPIYKLNSNENPLGPSPRVISALAEALGEIHLYPEASYFALREAIGRKFSISPEEVILGNGSNEIIELIFKAYIDRSDEVIISKPSFLMYEKFAQIYGVRTIEVPLRWDFKHNLEEISKVITSQTRAIFLDHPHNPTGSFLYRDEFISFLRGLPRNILIILDEAYGDFIDDPSVVRGLDLFRQFPNLIVLKTFSKAFGLAGLRLGFGVADRGIIENLNKVRQPFNVNLLAVKAGLAVLEDCEYVEAYRKLVIDGRKFLASELTALGFRVYPSQANFIMVDFGKWCDKLYTYLLNRGLFLRPLKAYGFENALRITIGTEEANRALIREIRHFLAG